MKLNNISNFLYCVQSPDCAFGKYLHLTVGIKVTISLLKSWSRVSFVVFLRLVPNRKIVNSNGVRITSVVKSTRVFSLSRETYLENRLRILSLVVRRDVSPEALLGVLSRYPQCRSVHGLRTPPDPSGQEGPFSQPVSFLSHHGKLVVETRFYRKETFEDNRCINEKETKTVQSFN